jgi:broad specificity phosphatase PhoE
MPDPAATTVPEGLDATIVLVRHGESEWVAQGKFQGRGDSPLSPLGRSQADLVAARLARPHRSPALPIPGGPPVLIASSPLSRAAETAEAIAAAMAERDAFGSAIPIATDDGLIEIGQGEWEGLDGAVVAEQWSEVLEGWRRDPVTAWAPGGESLPEVDGRVRASLEHLLRSLGGAANPTGEVRSPVLGYAEPPADEPWAVVVGHDGVFKVAMLALLDLPLARFWAFPFALCGITVVELRHGHPRLRLHNASDHLAPLEDAATAEREAARRRSGAL